MSIKNCFCKISVLLVALLLLLSFNSIAVFAEDTQQEDSSNTEKVDETTEEQSAPDESSSQNSSEQSSVPSQNSTPSKNPTSSVVSNPPQSAVTSVQSGNTSVTPEKPKYNYGDERGIIVGNGKYLTIPATDGIMNGSFEQGFKYWTTLAGSKPADVVTAEKEEGNTYISIKGGTVKDALVTPKFNAGNVMAGQRLVLIYDWRGSKDFIIKLNQVTGDNVTTIGTAVGETVVGNGTGADWSTSITRSIFDVIANYTDDGRLQFTVEISPMENVNSVTFIDNIRVGIYNKNNNHIYDIYGNLLYDMNIKDKSAADPKKNSEKQSMDEFLKSDSQDDNSSEDTDSTLIICILFIIICIPIIMLVAYKFFGKSRLVNKQVSKTDTYSSFILLDEQEEKEDNKE